MSCVHCGFSLAEGDTSCANCGKPVTPISVLSPDDRESFDGITIDQEGADRSGRNERPNQQRIYVRQVRFDGNNKLSGLLSILIIGFVVAVILFFAVPAILLMSAVAIGLWFFKAAVFWIKQRRLPMAVAFVYSAVNTLHLPKDFRSAFPYQKLP